jgi:hypothetical protein
MEKKLPLRLCIGCNAMKNKKEMIRIVKNEEGINLDKTGKKNGRGAYLCDDMECLEKAIKSRGLERSFKMAISKEIYTKLLEDMGK